MSAFSVCKREYSIILFPTSRLLERTVVLSSPFMVFFSTDVLSEKLEGKFSLSSTRGWVVSLWAWVLIGIGIVIFESNGINVRILVLLSRSQNLAVFFSFKLWGVLFLDRVYEEVTLAYGAWDTCALKAYVNVLIFKSNYLLYPLIQRHAYLRSIQNHCNQT